MVLARYRAVPTIKSSGCFGQKPLVAFTSDESHYSITKAVHWLGIGTDNLIRVKSDAGGRMIVDDLVGRIEEVLKEGRQPFFVNATAGTTVLGAFDDFSEIADVCRRFNIWLHVDVSPHSSRSRISDYSTYLCFHLRHVLAAALSSHESINIF